MALIVQNGNWTVMPSVSCICRALRFLISTASPPETVGPPHRYSLGWNNPTGLPDGSDGPEGLKRNPGGSFRS